MTAGQAGAVVCATTCRNVETATGLSPFRAPASVVGTRRPHLFAQSRRAASPPRRPAVAANSQPAQRLHPITRAPCRLASRSFPQVASESRPVRLSAQYPPRQGTFWTAPPGRVRRRQGDVRILAVEQLDQFHRASPANTRSASRRRPVPIDRRQTRSAAPRPGRDLLVTENRTSRRQRRSSRRRPRFVGASVVNDQVVELVATASMLGEIVRNARQRGGEGLRSRYRRGRRRLRWSCQARRQRRVRFGEIAVVIGGGDWSRD